MRETNFVLIAYTFRIVLFFSVLTRNTVLFFLPVPPYISLHFFNFTCHLNLYTLETLFLSLPLYIQHRFFFTHTHTCLFAPSRFSHSGHRNGVKLFRYFIPSSLVRRIIPDVSRGVEKRSGAVYLSQKAFFFFFFF